MPGKLGDRYQALAGASRSFTREGELDSFDLYCRWKSTVMDATGLSSGCLRDNTILDSQFNFFILSKESNQKRSLFCIMHGIGDYFQETP